MSQDLTKVDSEEMQKLFAEMKPNFPQKRYFNNGFFDAVKPFDSDMTKEDALLIYERFKK